MYERKAIPMRRLDLVGQTFGHLTVLEPAGNAGKHTVWRCRCDCGNETAVRTSSLRSGLTRSCGRQGCVFAAGRLDLAGQTFGHLTVLAPANNVDGRTAWLCRCGCGREAVVRSFDLRMGYARNCGDPECRFSGTKPPDLTGGTFGHLTVLGPERDARGHLVWRCRCACGRGTAAKAGTLRSGRAGSCGHPDCPWSAKRRLRDLAGRRYGGLTVLRRAEDVDGRPAWLCRCDCGRETVIRADRLRNGRARDCGCAGKGPGPASG